MNPDITALRLLLVLLALVAWPGENAAQQGPPLLSLPVTQPQAMSIDRLGQVYVSDRKNVLVKYSPAGQLLFTYSPAQQGRLTSVDAWNPVKTLLFYEDRQQVVLLDRFLSPITTIRLPDLSDGLIRLATLAADDQLWLFNESDFSLSKIDPRYPDSRLQTNLSQVLQNGRNDFRLLREYQNNLYLLDSNSGIYIFDNMGNYKKKLPVPGLSYLGFTGDEGYYLKDGQLVFFHLYTHQVRTLPLPAAAPYQQALIGNKMLYLFTSSHLDLYPLDKTR